MDGAGIMNLPTDVGGPTGQDGLDSYAPLIAAQQAARDIGYPRFTRELMAAGSEVDPAEVQEFLQEIRNAGIGPEELAIMRRVVEAVFNDPNNYPVVREQLLAEGVPEDILPETFDLEFFVALRLATEEAENLTRESRPTGQEVAPQGAMPEEMGQGITPPPLEMAAGGIAEMPQMKAVARELASMGRNGDKLLAHITPQEAVMLERMGGSGTINPYTGLPEFFLGGVFKAIGGAFKAVGKAIKKFASSTVGKIITTVALGAFLGPAAANFLGVSSAAGVAAVSGFVGSFGSGILAGESLQNSLRSGLTGAALAGGISAISGGSAALQERPELLKAYEKQGFLGTVKKTAQNFFTSPSAEAQRLFGTGETASQAPIQDIGTAQQVQAAGAEAAGALSGYPEYRFSVSAGPTPTDIAMGRVSTSAPTTYTPPRPEVLDFKPDYSLSGAPADSSTVGAVTPKAVVPESTFLGRTGDFLKDPSLSKFGDIFVDPNATGIARLKPAFYTAGLGYLATQGDKFFEVPEVEQPDIQGDYFADIAAARQRVAEEYPALLGSFLPPQGSPTYAPTYVSPSQPYASQGIPVPVQTYRAGMYQPLYRAAEGSGPEGVENFPRKNGHISGPGTGTSDDIPAMLSDGEFVFTAKAVRNMGGGSRRKGAAKMYRLMKMLEGGPVGKTAKA